MLILLNKGISIKSLSSVDPSSQLYFHHNTVSSKFYSFYVVLYKYDHIWFPYEVLIKIVRSLCHLLLDNYLAVTYLIHYNFVYSDQIEIYTAVSYIDTVKAKYEMLVEGIWIAF